MLGAIIGDIIGSRWRFCKPNNYNFEFFSNKNNYTDCTICMMGTAYALMNHIPYEKIVGKWRNKYSKFYGGENPQLYIISSDIGAIMQIIPISMWFGTSSNVYKYNSSQVYKYIHKIANHASVDNERFRGTSVIYDAIRMSIIYGKSQNNIIKCQNVQHLCHYLQDKYHYTKKLVLSPIFDATCDSVISSALCIIDNSKSFEDAIRRTVCLGGDSRILCSVVGSIAEHIWGIPLWIKEMVMNYLPTELQNVLKDFYSCYNRLNDLIRHCHYYKGEQFNPFKNPNKAKAWDIESKWALDLAKHFSSADRVKKRMLSLTKFNFWKSIADSYGLPLTLVGYIFSYTHSEGCFMHECVGTFYEFLDTNYRKMT